MKIKLLNNKQADLSKPIDISVKISNTGTKAWHIDNANIEPLTTNNFTGKVSEGGSVNFNNIKFNPHAHGTHTECVGHITKEFFSINNILKEFHFEALIITITPIKYKGKETKWRKKGDKIITKELIELSLKNKKTPKALIIRTLPNDKNKKTKSWSNTNWAYLDEDAAKYIYELGIIHLLIDLPSIDREEDGGKLLAHKGFWNYNDNVKIGSTITELIYVPNNVLDGYYLLNLQISSFHNDATPSKPVLYNITE